MKDRCLEVMHIVYKTYCCKHYCCKLSFVNWNICLKLNISSIIFAQNPGKLWKNREITDRYENQDPSLILNNFPTFLQGDDGRLPPDNPGRHCDEDEDCTKGKSPFTNHGDRPDQLSVRNDFLFFFVFINVARTNRN